MKQYKITQYFTPEVFNMTFSKAIVAKDQSLMKVIMSFHINTEKEKNMRKFDEVVKVISSFRDPMCTEESLRYFVFLSYFIKLKYKFI